MLPQKIFENVVSAACLSPSVHNTQPARWSLLQDNKILISADLDRFLSTGDPTFRDAGLSCGTATEATILALSQFEFGVGSVESLWHLNDCNSISGHRLAALVKNRFTWRAKFLPCSTAMTHGLDAWAGSKSDVTLATSSQDIDLLAELNDDASMIFMRDGAFRKELVSWMRLSRSHSNYHADGLNLEALQMNALEGLGAKLILGSSVFDVIDKIDLARALVGETEKTRSASAIALFHRPVDESPIESGRAFYRFWLEMTELGFVAWPMAAVADHNDSSDFCKGRFSIPEEHRLINVLRVGRTTSPRPKAARMSKSALILN